MGFQKSSNDDKNELYWCMVGDNVQTHFLYSSILTKERFNQIKKEVNKEINKLKR